MAPQPATASGGGDYDYPDDFTDTSDDHELPLPGLHAEMAINLWPGGEDWRLPGVVAQQSGSDSSNDSDDGDVDGEGGGSGQAGLHPPLMYPGSEAVGAHSPSTAASYQRDPWTMQVGATTTSRGAGPSGLMQPFERTSGASTQPPLRHAPATPVRHALFGPFGSSSLQHRDALPSSQHHPLMLTVQHHHHFVQPPPQRPQLPTPLQQQQQQQIQLQQQQQTQLGGGAGGGGVMSSGGGDAGEEGGAGGTGGGGAGGEGWSYLTADPFAPVPSSSCSSSVSASRNPSPTPHPAAPPYALPGGTSGPQQWYGSQYTNSQYEQDFGLGLGLGRRTSGAGDTGGILSRGGEGQSLGLGHELAALGLGLGQLPPAAPRPSASRDSSRSSHSSWGIGGNMGGGYEGTGQAVGQAAALWPLGGGDGRPSDSGSASAAGWRASAGPGERLQRHGSRNRASEVSDGWRPSGDGEGSDALESPSVAGTSSSQLQGIGEPTWDRQYGGLRASTSFGLSLGGTGGSTANCYSPRSSMGGSGLSVLGGLGPGGSAHSGGGSTLPPLGLAQRAGLDGGGTRCFTSIDSPSGPYDRRRVVLTSAHRRSPPTLESATPTVRQYSDGLAGVLTNAQIQEWMSQHASRLLLPRHMHEIADIVFRPQSAVPEKKPPKCQSGNLPVATLPPPVVLAGRYPPLHVSRIVGDTAFMTSLLAGLAGVDPDSSRLQAMVTALQGKDVVVPEEDVEPPPLMGKTLRPVSGHKAP